MPRLISEADELGNLSPAWLKWGLVHEERKRCRAGKVRREREIKTRAKRLRFTPEQCQGACPALRHLAHCWAPFLLCFLVPCLAQGACCYPILDQNQDLGNLTDLNLDPQGRLCDDGIKIISQRTGKVLLGVPK